MRSAGVLLAVALLVGCSAGARRGAGSVQRIAIGNASALEVDADNGAVALTGVVASPSVVVSATAKGAARSSLPVSWVRVGRRLVVTIGGGAGASQIPFVATGGAAFRVRYPSGLPLYVRAFGGDVHLRGSTGAVQVTDAQGDVTVVGPRASLEVDNGSGDVSVAAAQAGLDLATQHGQISATLAAGWKPHPIRLESGNGDVLLTVPRSFAAHVDASSGAGVVRDGLAPAARRVGGPPVWLYTASGSATIVVAPPA